MTSATARALRASLGTTVMSDDDQSGDRATSDVALAGILQSLATAPSLELSDPTLLKRRFQIERRLGEGGFGVVYQAIERRDGSRVAVKVLRHAHPDWVRRFKREFRAVGKISHRNLVRLDELTSDGTTWFFTMEFVDGIPFLDYLIMRPEELPASFVQLAEGLRALHQAGKIHRDIKPSNILVDKSGRVVILDFGLAMDASPEISTNVVGTPCYMSPEQVAHQSLTEASDWYAFGLVLYEALTGRRLFESRGSAAAAAGQDEAAAAFDKIHRVVPPQLKALTLSLLTHAAASRPGVDAIVEALVDGQPAVTQSQTLPGMQDPGVLSPDRGEAFIGRDAELAALHDAYATTSGGRAAIVLVSGESGIGKTRLVRAFLESVHRGAVVLAGRCHERESVPYNAFDGIFDELAALLKRLGADAAALLPRDAAALARLFPALRSVEPFARAPVRNVTDAQEQQRHAVAAMQEMLERMRDRWSIVLHVDDAQWIDHDSVSLFASMVNRADAVSVLWILNYRTGERPRAPVLADLVRVATDNRLAGIHKIGLEPLAATEAASLARLLLVGDEAQVTRLASAIALESAGSPLFVRQLANYSRLFVNEDRAIPSLSSAVLAQIDDAPRALLDALAVAARPIEAQLALRATHIKADGTATLNALRNAQLLRFAKYQDATRVEIYHDRIRAAVISAMSALDIRQLHARFAESLRLDTYADPEQLAIHLQGAGELQAAAEQMLIAATAASKVLAFDRAAKHYGDALSFGSFERPLEHQIQQRHGEALAHAGRGKQGAEVLLKASEGAPTDVALDLRRRAGELLLLSGHTEQALELLEGSLRELRLPIVKSGRGGLASLIWQRCLLAIRGLGYRLRHPQDCDSQLLRRVDAYWACARGLGLIDNIRASDYGARFVRLALRAGEPRRVFTALTYESVMQTMSNSHRRAAALLDAAERLARVADDPHTWASLRLSSGCSAFCRGSHAHADQDLKLAIKIYREQCAGAVWDTTTAYTFRSWSLWFLGEYRELSESLPPIVGEAQQRGDLFGAVTLSTGVLATAWLARDDVTEATRLVASARGSWQSVAYSIQDGCMWIGESLIDFYNGDELHAWMRIEREWPKLRRAPFMREINTRTLVMAMQIGGALVAARARSVSRETRAKLLSAAEASTIQLSRLRHSAARGFAPLARASIASARGQDGRVVKELDAACTVADELGFTVLGAVARRQLGAIVGGDNGADLIHDADAVMHAQGIVRPAQIARMLAPGLERA